MIELECTKACFDVVERRIEEREPTEYIKL